MSGHGWKKYHFHQLKSLGEETTTFTKLRVISEGKVPGPNTDLYKHLLHNMMLVKICSHQLSTTNQAILSGNYANRKELNSQVLPLFTGHHCQKQKKHSQFLFPKTKEEEDYQTHLAIQESQFTAASCTDAPFNTPDKTSTATSTHSNLETLAQAAIFMSESLAD